MSDTTMMSFLLALLKERQSKKRRLRPAPAGQCHGRRPAGEVPPLLTPPLQARLVTASVIPPLLYLALRDPPRLDPARPAAAAAWPAAAGTGATPRRGFCSPGPLGGGAAYQAVVGEAAGRPGGGAARQPARRTWGPPGRGGGINEELLQQIGFVTA
jgi:hypothetical protein